VIPLKDAAAAALIAHPPKKQDAVARARLPRPGNVRLCEDWEAAVVQSAHGIGRL